MLNNNRYYVLIFELNNNKIDKHNKLRRLKFAGPRFIFNNFIGRY